MLLFLLLCFVFPLAHLRPLFFRHPWVFSLLLVYAAGLSSGLCFPISARASLRELLCLLAFFLPWGFPLSSKSFGRGYAICGGVCGALGIYEFVSGHAPQGWVDATLGHVGGRACVFFSNPNLFCAFLLPAVFFCLEAFAQEKSIGRRMAATLCLLLCLGGVGVSFCRGGWLGLCLAFLFWVGRQKQGGFFLTVVICALPGVFFCLPAPVRLRFLSLFTGDSSMGYRSMLWRSIGQMPPLSLLSGIGCGRPALEASLLPYAAAGLEGVEHTHSLWLHALCAAGLVGAVALFLLTLAALKKAHKGADAFQAAWLALVLFGTFDDPLYSIPIGVVTWFLLGVNFYLQYVEQS